MHEGIQNKTELQPGSMHRAKKMQQRKTSTRGIKLVLRYCLHPDNEEEN